LRFEPHLALRETEVANGVAIELGDLASGARPQKPFLQQSKERMRDMPQTSTVAHHALSGGAAQFLGKEKAGGRQGG
jgi:hypothetical protein